MGRASRDQAERNRRRVVEAACRLFRMHGVENVSIADVMNEAGLTPGGFYKQFESKDALINEAFALAFEQSSQAWDSIMNSGEPAAHQALTALVKHYFKHRPAEQNCPILTFSSLASHLPADAQALDVYGNGVEALFGQFRNEALKLTKQENTRLPAEHDATLLFSAMIGAGLLGKAIGHTPLVRQMQATVLDAVSKREAGDDPENGYTN